MLMGVKYCTELHGNIFNYVLTEHDRFKLLQSKGYQPSILFKIKSN